MSSEALGVKNSKRKKKGFNLDFSILGLLIILLIFFGRCFNVMANSFERGGLAYVQMLNYGLPLVEELTYDEEDYAESEMSLKNVALEAIGLSEIGPQSILNGELPLVKTNSTIAKNDIPNYDDFKLGDEAVSKYDKNEKGPYNEKLKEELKNSKPKILIYNTHSTENYSDSKKFTTNSEHNVVGVVEVIAKELKEKYGIEVIHDKTVHDISYNGAYLRTQETIKRYVNKYGNDFDLVLDIHRDGVKDLSLKAPFYTKINGDDLAKIMFVNSKSSPFFSYNDKVAREMIKISDKLFPGLTRQSEPMTYNHGKYGLAQQIAKNSVLIEVGANSNTSQEAQNTGKYIARIIAEYINNK
ncbi:stage II sporulation protein P [Clostridium thermobutyricum]|uniref:Stage II sporulation protein P (SpoIIP) n=1 Tax=Clostridium thermobutyricum DSM 4928 TaxID=1121339 RepID=A0A1V4SPV1_9CLOT|nr:stage II sporulation protein P [Clostridium thermobutyricum]OPX45301.1 stage II sporulation protein P (SpoIIP) [Clostridium thermobutyricum DSM 4928]